MKLRDILMCLAAVSVLFSCSDDNGPVLNEEPPQPTMMSIAVDADGTIITRADDPTDATITNMYVLVFKMNGELLIAEPMKGEDTISDDSDPVTGENVDIPVESGYHKVLVLANVKDENIFNDKPSLATIQVMTTELSGELDGNLTMSSEVMTVDFQAGKKNKIGYSTMLTNEVDVYPTLGGYPVKLYRSVARIQLSKLALANEAIDPNYGQPVSFKLTQLFIANAKGYSYLASDAARDDLTIEVPDVIVREEKGLWRYGDWAEYTDGDVLMQIEENIETTPDVLLSYKYPESEEVLVDAGESQTDNEGIGNYFYVYENEGRDIGYQTLLVLKGDYTYRRSTSLFGETANENSYDAESGTYEYTAKDRYYAIVINPNGIEADKTSHDDNVLRHGHKGIVRNNKYILTANLNGPGSDRPYRPDAHLYFNSEVVVAPWDAEIFIGDDENPHEVN